MKVLFIHNSLSEYRFEFWRKLKEKVNLDLLITHKNLENKLYGLVDGKSEFDEKYWTLKFWLLVPNNIKEYDVVVLPPTDSVLDFLISIYILFYCKIYGKRTVLWSESWFRWKQFLHPLKAIKIIAGAIMKIIVGNGVNRIVVPGKQAYNYITHLPIGNVSNKTLIAVDSCTSPFVSTPIDIRQEYDIPANCKIILFLGRIIDIKGLDVLIKAANNLLPQNNAFLIVAGDGPQKSYCENLVSGKAKEHIMFIGKVSPSLRRAYYEQADVFVVPSRFNFVDGCIDVWALTVNESLECGTPVITTTDVGSSYDLININNGRVVNPNDSIELKDAIEDILFKSKLYLNRSTIAKDYLRNHSIDIMTNGFVNAFMK